MTAPTPNSFSLPSGVTEADLIDLVDGVVPAQREAALIEALRREPRLGLLVKQMRADRSAVVEAMAAVPATPRNLLEGIESRLDRAALSELVAEAEHAPAAIPISTVQPARRGLVQILAESAWSRRLATAASIAVVGGIGYLAVRELTRKWPALPGNAPVVHVDPNANRGTGVTVPGDDDAAATALAMGDGGPEVPNAASEPATTMVAAAEEPGVTGPLTASAALRLAEQGRLVITVRSTGYESTLRHLEDLSRTSARDTRWRALTVDSLPREFAALATPLPDETLPGTGRPGAPWRDGPPAYASESGQPGAGPLERNLMGPPFYEPGRVVVRALRTVETSATERSLDDLLKDLAVAKSHEARYRVLPEGLAIEVKPSLDAESVLWWTRGPGNWNARVTVPVVVETVE